MPHQKTSNLDNELSPRASTFYSDLYMIDENVRDHSPEAHRVSHPTPYSSHAGGRTRASTVTLFPSSVTSKVPDFTMKPADAYTKQCKSTITVSESAKNQSYFMELYLSAKRIYEAGPKGEGQALWSAYKHYRAEKKNAGRVLEICAPRTTDKTITQASEEWKSAHSIFRPPPTDLGVTLENTVYQKPRHDSAKTYGGVSLASREVPIKLRRTILDTDKPLPPTPVSLASGEVPIKLSRTILDTDKPLPPTPPMRAPPRPRRKGTQGKALNVNKPLPRTPLPCFSENPYASREQENVNPVDASQTYARKDMVSSTAAGSHSKVPWQGSSAYDQRTKHVCKEKQATAWIKVPFKTNKAGKRDALKAKISRPIPIESRVEVSTADGDIGGVGAMTSQFSTERPGTVRSDAKGKQKVLSPSSLKTWRDKLPHPTMPIMHMTKRPDSEASFACQGLLQPTVYIADPGPSVQGGGPRMKAEDLMPDPLFSGTNDGRRDSERSYYDVLDEYADQRRTGRWI